MAGPSWLAGTFAAVMILIAAFSAGRLVMSRVRKRATEYDADALHVVMGTAMAGMLVPQLNPLPGMVWVTVFVAAAAWFGFHAVRGRGLSPSGAARCRYPVPHVVECAAMLYMLLPAIGPRPAHQSPGMAMAAMGASTGFPALAVVLALFMAGYIVWTTDRLASLARARGTAAPPMLAPKLAACCKIAMSVTMGYMLIVML